MARKKQPKRRGWMTAATADRHDLYERAVQEPNSEIDFVDRAFKERHGRLPRTMREDFCGTAYSSCTFVARRATNWAVGVDLCRRTLEWGMQRHGLRLKPAQRKRMQWVEGDVRQAGTTPVDVLSAMNFSYYIFKTRPALVEYLRAALRNVAPGGIIVMDAYGGHDSFSVQSEERNLDGYTYHWDTAKYNPITGEVLNHIHFEFPDGTWLRKAFTYDWRLWTLPEIQEALVDAGFVKPCVYWEGTDHRTGGGNGVFRKAKVGEACAGWIAYVVAERPAGPKARKPRRATGR